jgi:hypothetical protein
MSAVYYNSIRNTGITLPAALHHSETLQVLGSQIAMGLTVTWVSYFLVAFIPYRTVHR